MRWRRRGCIGLLAALGLAFSLDAAAEPTRCMGAGHDRWVPFSYLSADGSVDGAGHDIMRRAVALAGGSFDTVHVGPWKRVFGSLNAGVIDIVVTAVATEERKRQHLLTRPFAAEDMALAVRRDAPFTYSSWDDLRGLKAIVARGVALGMEWDSFASASLEAIESPTAIEGLRMLAAGRGDFAASTRFVLEHAIAKEGLGDRIRVVEKPLALVPVHAMIRRDSPCAALLPGIDAALAAMQESGEIERILQRHADPALFAP